ncbi:hypothetical protein CC2G_011697 [Coprinopsis cinerea AmutBmut pab1-1]|nr:hypothetical protein CC2G_011697 [Coprinopsis cinerea AmutBmut pab1-1]
MMGYGLRTRKRAPNPGNNPPPANKDVEPAQEVEPPLTREGLEKLNRRELQAVAKKHKVPANLKSQVIIEELLKKHDATNASTSAQAQVSQIDQTSGIPEQATATELKEPSPMEPTTRVSPNASRPEGEGELPPVPAPAGSIPFPRTSIALPAPQQLAPQSASAFGRIPSVANPRVRPPTVDPRVRPSIVDPRVRATVDPRARPPAADPRIQPPTADPRVRQPTADPRVRPTVDPRVRPTVDPRVRPTADPRIQPPTADPRVRQPTADPRVRPTVDPRVRPTADPRIQPPTADPRVRQPTADPRVRPTVDPRVRPTADPRVRPPPVGPTRDSPARDDHDQPLIGSDGCTISPASQNAQPPIDTDSPSGDGYRNQAQPLIGSDGWTVSPTSGNVAPPAPQPMIGSDGCTITLVGSDAAPLVPPHPGIGSDGCTITPPESSNGALGRRMVERELAPPYIHPFDYSVSTFGRGRLAPRPAVMESSSPSSEGELPSASQPEERAPTPEPRERTALSLYRAKYGPVFRAPPPAPKTPPPAVGENPPLEKDDEDAEHVPVQPNSVVGPAGGTPFPIQKQSTSIIGPAGGTPFPFQKKGKTTEGAPEQSTSIVGPAGSTPFPSQKRRKVAREPTPEEEQEDPVTPPRQIISYSLHPGLMATSSASYVPQKENTLADIVNRDRAQENQSSEKSSIVSGNPTSWGFPSPRSAAQRESTPSHEYDEDAENRDPNAFEAFDSPLSQAMSHSSVFSSPPAVIPPEKLRVGSTNKEVRAIRRDLTRLVDKAAVLEEQISLEEMVAMALEEDIKEAQEEAKKVAKTLKWVEGNILEPWKKDRTIHDGTGYMKKKDQAKWRKWLEENPQEWMQKCVDEEGDDGEDDDDDDDDDEGDIDDVAPRSSEDSAQYQSEDSPKSLKRSREEMEEGEEGEEAQSNIAVNAGQNSPIDEDDFYL